jgi:hypothetical protein
VLGSAEAERLVANAGMGSRVAQRHPRRSVRSARPGPAAALLLALAPQPVPVGRSFAVAPLEQLRRLRQRALLLALAPRPVPVGRSFALAPLEPLCLCRLVSRATGAFGPLCAESWPRRSCTARAAALGAAGRAMCGLAHQVWARAPSRARHRSPGDLTAAASTHPNGYARVRAAGRPMCCARSPPPRVLRLAACGAPLRSRQPAGQGDAKSALMPVLREPCQGPFRSCAAGCLSFARLRETLCQLASRSRLAPHAPLQRMNLRTKNGMCIA